MFLGGSAWRLFFYGYVSGVCLDREEFHVLRGATCFKTGREHFVMRMPIASDVLIMEFFPRGRGTGRETAVSEEIKPGRT